MDADTVILTRENIPEVSKMNGRTEEALLRALEMGEARNQIVHVSTIRPAWRK